MYAVERRRWLIDSARRQGRLDVATVARELDVAPETVRRDLTALERRGLLKRVYGGAVPVERLGFEESLAVRVASRAEEKIRIAEYALGLIDTADSIFLDEGSSLQLLAERLNPGRRLLVVTNSLAAATVLAGRDHVTTYILGGRVRGHTLGTVEHWAVAMLDDFVLDLALFGTNGVSFERGLTCPDSVVAAVKAKAVSVSRRRILLADGSKFGADSSYRFCHIRDLNTVVTDRSAGDSTLRKIRSLGVEAVAV